MPAFYAGFGCRRGCPADTLEILLRQALATQGLALADLQGIASISLKADEPGLQQLAERLGSAFGVVRYRAVATLRTPAQPPFRRCPCPLWLLGRGGECGTGPGQPAGWHRQVAADAPGTGPGYFSPWPVERFPSFLQGLSMTVYFIGAGPGDPELITIKGQRLIRQWPGDHLCRLAGAGRRARGPPGRDRDQQCRTAPGTNHRRHAQCA
ncbi:putative cobalamin biosynthesis protein cobE [Pseudomonas putida S11]|nr:putative cobalamin biosynthesis protein cobE [Pseudomonas putida S11]